MMNISRRSFMAVTLAGLGMLGAGALARAEEAPPVDVVHVTLDVQGMH